jgi:Flp pilus assembly protein TadD
VEGEIQKAPERAELRLIRGNLLVRNGQYDPAIQIFQEVAAKYPKSAEMQLRVGEAYRRKGDLPKAIESFNKAKELSPNDPQPYLTLAVLLDMVGRGQEAQPLYEQLLKLRPDDPIGLNNLAWLIAETGNDLERAESLATRARQRAPKSPDIADTLGWIYIKRNLSDEAIRIYKDLVVQHPDNAGYRYHLGMALSQKGDKPGARKELELALQKGPRKEDEPKIRELLRKLS